MKKIAIINAIMDKPSDNQRQFNEIVSDFNGVVKGRLGMPFDEKEIGVICLVVVADIEDINRLTENLCRIHGVQIQTTIADK